MDQGTNPVNPYAPTGAPYAPGSNTPAPDFTSISPVPEKPKLFSKKFIIFASIGIVLIIAAVVAGIILQSQHNSISRNAPASQQEATARELSNLFIYGNKSTDIPDFETETWYIVEQLVSARDENTSIIDDYINEAKALISVLPSNIASDINSHFDTYAGCLLLDRYESNEAASVCLSSADALKTDVKKVYDNISGVKS